MRFYLFLVAANIARRWQRVPRLRVGTIIEVSYIRLVLIVGPTQKSAAIARVLLQPSLSRELIRYLSILALERGSRYSKLRGLCL